MSDTGDAIDRIQELRKTVEVDENDQPKSHDHLKAKYLFMVQEALFFAQKAGSAPLLDTAVRLLRSVEKALATGDWVEPEV